MVDARGRPGADVGVRKDEDGRDDEHNAKQRQSESLEQVDEVVAVGRDEHLRHHDYEEAEPEPCRAKVDKREQRECAADAVDDKPADGTGEGVEAGGEDVAEEAERAAALHHHGHAELGTPRRQNPVGQRPERASDEDGERCLPEAEPEHGHAEHPDEDRGELEVWRQPRPEEVDRFSVPLLQGDVFDAAWLDSGDPLPVVALPDGYVLLYVLGCGHTLPP